MTGIQLRGLPHTVTVVHPVVAADRYGNGALTYPDDASSHTTAAFVQPRTQTEQFDQRDSLTGDWTMLTNDTDVGGHDRVLWSQDSGPTLTFEVVGPNAAWDNPAGFHHNEVLLRYVEG